VLSLRDRLILVNAAIFLVALPLLAALMLSQLVKGLYDQLDRGLEIVTYTHLGRIELANGHPQFSADSTRPRAQLGAEGFVRLLDTQGQVIDGYGAYWQTPVLAQSLTATAQGLVFNQISQAGTRLRVYTLPVTANNQTVGYIQVADDQESLLETVGQVRRNLLIGAPISILISALLSFFTIRQALGPLTTMTRSAAKISDEALDERLPVPGVKDEVYALATAFNATLDRLAAAFVRQRRFTANASHELRTPVTAILGHAELALDRPRSAQEYQRSMERIQTEAARMQRVIERMLTLARVDMSRQPLDLSPTNLSQLAETLVDTLRPHAAEKGLTLTVHTPPHLILTTDADSLTQILLNLLENAIAYTDEGGITLTLTPNADHVRIAVSDTGSGIPPEHLPHIFQPFYRVDPARSRRGAGLGLTLTRELAQLLGGDIQAANQPGRGTTFTLTLPT
jgi:heavy metal sensor kinase